jgi:uncharacterized protein (DUF58 family)
MILTRRGYAVVGVVAGSLLMAVLYGPRSLNAVVAPGVVALVAAVLMVTRVDEPTVERVTPEDGFVGEDRTVTLSVRSDSSFTGRVVDRLPGGLVGQGNDVTTTIEDEPIEYELAYAWRGEHRIGPTRVTVRDVLGLAQKQFTYTNETSVLVYPRIRDLGPRARRELHALPEFRMVSMRGEFDSLREYERGDALRDIDWKSSAKRPADDLIVKEYTEEDDLGAIKVVAEATEGRASADAMAEATASIVAFLLEANLTVSVSAPAGLVEPGTGKYQRNQMLELLARTDTGRVPKEERREADIYVEGRSTGQVSVRIEDQLVPFEALVGATGGPTTRPEA